jgi:hypothetical protein
VPLVVLGLNMASRPNCNGHGPAISLRITHYFSHHARIVSLQLRYHLAERSAASQGQQQLQQCKCRVQTFQVLRVWNAMLADRIDNRGQPADRSKPARSSLLLLECISLLELAPVLLSDRILAVGATSLAPMHVYGLPLASVLFSGVQSHAEARQEQLPHEGHFPQLPAKD